MAGTSAWNKLRAAQKAEVIRLALENGISDINSIRGAYNLYSGEVENEFSEGGKIHIKPSKKGTFTAAATRHGKGVQEFARQVLAHKENYSPAMVKKANFARNAAHWHDGETSDSLLHVDIPIQQNDVTNVNFVEPVQAIQMAHDVYMNTLAQQSLINQGVVRDEDIQRARESGFNPRVKESNIAKEIQAALDAKGEVVAQEEAAKAFNAVLGMSMPSTYYNLANLDNPMSEEKALAVDLGTGILLGGAPFAGKLLKEGLSKISKNLIIKNTIRDFNKGIRRFNINDPAHEAFYRTLYRDTNFGNNLFEELYKHNIYTDSHNYFPKLGTTNEKLTNWVYYSPNLIHKVPVSSDYMELLRTGVMDKTLFSEAPESIRKFHKSDFNIFETQVFPRMVLERPWLDSNDFLKSARTRIGDTYYEFPKEIFQKAFQKEGIAGGYFPSTDRIVIQEGTTFKTLPHEVRHRLDSGIELTENEERLLDKAFGKEFTDLFDADERVTTNLDARLSLFRDLERSYHPNIATYPVEAQNSAITFASTDAIKRAFLHSNNYGKVFINSLEGSGKFTPERIDALKEAMMKVGMVGVPLSFGIPQIQTSKKSTGGPLYPFSFSHNPYIKTPDVRYADGGHLFWDGGGFFSKLFAPTYEGDFTTAFANARADNKPYFKWNGERYSTQWETEKYREEHPEEYTPEFAFSDATARITREENNKANPNGGYIPELNAWVPHNSVEGGAKTVSYGLKLDKHNQAVIDELNRNKSKKYPEGYITDEFAINHINNLLRNSYAPAAKKTYDGKFGEGEWDKLSPKAQSLLLDYQYNVSGGLKTFPNLMQGFHDNDYEKIAANYKRYTGGKPLGRNKGIAKELEQIFGGYYSIYK